MSSSSPPSWLKTTPLHIEEIARHHIPHTIYLPALNDNDERETLAPEKYDSPAQTAHPDSLGEEYQWQHLSQESGIYNKPYTFPRSLLWRVVSGSTLTIHAIDTTRPKSFPRNRPLTALHFRFPVNIRLNCIGFAETEYSTQANTLLNVLTEDCVLYTITLRDGVFTGEKRGTERIMEDMTVQRPLFMLARFGAGKLSLDLPHFMYPVQNTETVIFAMQDGSLQVYNTRDSAYVRFSGDASFRRNLKAWIPTWSGHNPSYPSHLILSSVASTKHSLLFTVSADQRLRIWSLENQQFVKEYDLTFSPATTGRLLPSAPAQLLSLDDSSDHGEFLFYLMTYNPLEEGQFQIWGGQHVHGAFHGLQPLQEPIKPERPAGSTVGTYNVSGFFLAEVKTMADSHGQLVQNTYERTLRLWVAWKSYVSLTLQYTDIHSPTQWTTVMTPDDFTDRIDDEVENTVDFWSDRITSPGRYSDAVLFTALNLYQQKFLQPDQRRDLTSSTARHLRKDLLAGILGRKLKLQVNQHSGQLDFEKYRVDLSLEFSQFDATCRGLSSHGGEFRRLSFDSLTGDVFVVSADRVSALRNLSGAEILQWGATGSDGQFQAVVYGDEIRGTLYGEFKDIKVRLQVVALARAAFKFRCAIAGGNLGDLTAGLLEEVMSDSNFAVEDRMWAFYDKYLSDELFLRSGMKEDVLSALATVTELSAAFRVLLDILSTDICQDDTAVPLSRLSAVWGDVVTLGVAETVSARWTLLRDFALLAAWLYSTEEQIVDQLLRKSLETYWSEGLRAFKGVNMLRHLAATEIAPTSSRQSAEDQVSGSMEDMHLDDSVEIVHLPARTNALRYLVEDTLDSSGVGLNNISFPPTVALSLVIASILTQINFADGYSGMAIRILSQLVRLDANVEAARFARYLPNTPVGGYVWGHVLLQKGDWEKAGVWFSRVAPILAKSGRAFDFEYAKVILRGKQVEGIGKGLFRYYEHVARLFDSKHAHSQTTYYCQRALAVAEDESWQVKDNLLMLSFNNAIDIANYDDAYTSLTQLTNFETQRAALEVLIVAMVEHNQSGRLCAFPFPSLQDLVDEILLQRAEEVIDIRPYPSYHKVLFAWRIRHGDFQGGIPSLSPQKLTKAASVMYQRLQLLRNASTTDMDVDLETLEISEAYLAVINALSCVSENNAWIFVLKVNDVEESPAAKRVKREEKGTRTRIALSLAEVRKEYAVELERQQIILGKVADEFALEGVDI